MQGRAEWWAKYVASNPRGARPVRRWSAKAALLLCVLAVGIPASAIAQQYKSDPVDERALRNLGAAQGCAKGTLNYAAEKARVADYFIKGYFPEMSRFEPVALGKLGDARFNLFRRYLWATSNQQMQADLTEWAFAAMKNMAAPGYHPAVRYNAILTIGMLDAQYAIDAGSNRRPPKPLPKANEFLTKIVAAGAAGNRVVSPPLLAGALVGLERHATFRDGLSPEALAAMTAASLKIAGQEKPSLEMGRQVHAWMRLKAARVLAALGSVGTNKQVHDALVKLVAEGRSLDDRCEVAALFAKVNYDGAKIDAEAATTQMLALARDVATYEGKQAEEFRDRRFSGGGGASSYRGERGGYFGGEGGSMYLGEDQDDYPRRPAVARLYHLVTGLTALKPAVAPEAQQKFDAIIAAVNPALNVAADEDSIALNVARQMVTMADAVKNVAGAPADDEEASAELTASFEEPVEQPVEAPADADEAPDGAEPPAAAAPAVPQAGAAPADAAPANGQ